MDAKTTLELFKELGRLQATNEQILKKLETMDAQQSTNDQRYMPREELLSRFREVRASTIIAVMAIICDVLLLWHWMTAK